MIETNYFEIMKPKYYLCKPNLKRTTIANLTEVTNDTQKLSRGNVNELTLSLPLYLNKTERRVKNKHIDMVKEKYLIRVEKGNELEYYIIDKIAKSMDDTNIITLECFSLPFELSSKLIKNYSVVSYNATQLLVDMLESTIWNIGYIDTQFDLKYRSFDFSGSVLEAVQQIASNLSALIVWDTVKREVSFYDPDTYGMNKGFKTKYGKLMKGVTQELNLDEFCTRLHLFGKDDMSIQSVNPLGTNFIQDFSYFMYPFATDDNGTVVSHSLYMSDELCLAIQNYNKLIETKSTEYSSLLTQKTNLDTTLATKQTELSTLQTEFNIISDQLDTANGTGQPTDTLIQQKAAKQAQIDAKQAEIVTVNTQITGVISSMQSLGNSLKMENNFTSDQLIELNQFIIEKEMSDSNYTDPKDLLEDGKKKFEKMREPKIIATVSLVNFYEIMTEKHNWDKLSIGDVITVEHEELGIHIKANVTDIEFDYQESNIDVTVSNVVELLTDEERFMKDHLKNISTSNTVNMNQYKWDDAKATVDDVTIILNNTWDAVKRDISAGVNEDVSISRRGIIIRDPKDPNKLLIMQHGQIALSNDNGNTWKTAITPEGVFAERLVGKILLGNKLIISDDDGTFTIEGNLLTIKDETGATKVELGEYQTNKYGLRIRSAKGDVVLDEDGIIQTDTIQLADNVDSSHSLKLKFYIDDGVMSVNKVKLNFSIERFRAYSTAADSQTINLTTTQSATINLNTTASASIDLTSTQPQNVSGSTQTEGTYFGVGGHNHGIPEGTQLAVAGSTGAYVTWVASGNHQHPVSLGSHSHSITVPPHSHSISMPSHAHSISMPPHSHNIVYGIYESTYASNVQVKIDGVIRNGTQYNSDQANLDLTQWIQTPGWHTIELTSSQLGRINASLYIRSFVGF